MNKNEPPNYESPDEAPDEATLKLLQCAFPDGLREEEYFPLLNILRQDMTIRAASSLVGMLLFKGYLDVYNDALGANSSRHTLDTNVIKDLEHRLEACGYKVWLDS